ncbi:hypothetical protein D806_019480 [Mycolicibacterium smegmatis MKD8]|uniref:Uncharacterized protein n=1 Tax=Mycolicibacterium smegmatis (strain MKD8) TaxID=1214915 RepID=A0A2U9PMI2_MYCSE|nr:hypothetical protein D806_019480 [Mycolicibacterium smegmatis MKD8]
MLEDEPTAKRHKPAAFRVEKGRFVSIREKSYFAESYFFIASFRRCNA